MINPSLEELMKEVNEWEEMPELPNDVHDLMRRSYSLALQTVLAGLPEEKDRLPTSGFDQYTRNQGFNACLSEVRAGIEKLRI